MTPEGKVKAKVKKLLQSYNCYQFWPVQSGYGAATLDCLGSCNGHFFAIETKAPGKHLTARQKMTKQDIENSSAVVFIIGERQAGTGRTAEYSGIKELDLWLKSVSM